ncbi:hypothetical protein VSR01_10565 [Actinacidiphila sp. DG2A-62]|uniref:hypothetical protein n=1 Tax=Actinacidiphila sp. DG2A-62 TaxID=3108821 RepID=UPI002DBDBA0E|nr:hypothetical protein [Actinacidiphila sp. DG2A-62]MEC3993960.1 hypothetical protein [Actinacidiphila sp. DG2A-62]
MTTTLFVVTVAESPNAAAASLDAAKAHAVAHETRYSSPELRWDEYRPGVWRLMSRYDGFRRFSWSQVAVHAVPEVTA